VSTKIALTSNEPHVHILVPVRFLPQLVAFLAAAANAGVAPCVETTAEPVGPSVTKALPPNVRQLPARKAAG
jgi:hypothetical protein